jgi:predicted YcjX-like family ATPase
MTAAEAAVLLAFFGLAGDRNRCRKTIVMWAQRGRIVSHGEVEGDPAYQFGEILDRAEAPAQAATA